VRITLPSSRLQRDKHTDPCFEWSSNNERRMTNVTKLCSALHVGSTDASASATAAA